VCVCSALSVMKIRVSEVSVMRRSRGHKPPISWGTSLNSQPNSQQNKISSLRDNKLNPKSRVRWDRAKRKTNTIKGVTLTPAWILRVKVNYGCMEVQLPWCSGGHPVHSCCGVLNSRHALKYAWWLEWCTHSHSHTRALLRMRWDVCMGSSA
jgi:hypothetical protein